jgi:hypothetical protein
MISTGSPANQFDGNMGAARCGGHGITVPLETSARGGEGRKCAWPACAATGIGTGLPLIVPGGIGLLLSATFFGAFFIGPTSVTAFSRKNLPAAQWGRSVALFTTILDPAENKKLERGAVTIETLCREYLGKANADWC